MSEPLLRVAGLSVRYGAARVIDHLDLEIDEGEIVGLVGPNGAGKTSTLKAISGVVARRATELTFAGKPLPPRPEVVAAAGIAHAPEGRGLVPSLTTRQNIELGAAAVGRRVGREQWSDVLELFPKLEEHLGRHAGHLSGGQQQMVAIARGLVSGARMLMIDELSLGLAPRVVTDLLTALQQVARRRNIALLLVDQNVTALARVCDRGLTIRRRTGTVVDLASTDVIHSDYLGRRPS
jgi:branched-chain amino acid transport system ATP-binding protein